MPYIAWLSQRASTLSQDDLIEAREQVFAIIGADVKRRARTGAPGFPGQTDTVVARLYEWAHQLGVPGARLAAQRFGFSPSANDASVVDTPGFGLALDTLYTLVSEADGWMVRFPYYFMIGTATRQVLNNGQATSVAVLSTLFAKDSSVRSGASQATIMLLSARAAAPEMAAYWLQQLGVAVNDTVSNLVPNAVRTYRSRDNAARMTRELVIFAPPGRTILAAYIGNDGTFETNHQHFLDLLGTLRIRSGP